MYEQFFNLKTKPFELVPNPDFLYPSRSHKKALVYLDYGIRERIGFILLTGEVGSGKTTIIRNLIKSLNGKVTLSKVFNTKVTSEQLISMINEDFGLAVRGKDKITLLRELNDFLIEQYANKSHAILIIDEAQNLTPELLEEIRMLSNLETDTSKLLQIILVGQPELNKTIARPELRQLRQRISVSCNILPLKRPETEEYILHRLAVAGNRNAVIFSGDIVDTIHNFSRGVPRLVNIICDFLMLSAFVEGSREITPELAREVVGELEIEHRYWQDELPVRNVPDNGGALKEMMDRISKIEEESFKVSLSPTEKTEIFKRLASSEKILDNYFARTQSDLNTLSDIVKDILNELNITRNQIAEIQRRVHDAREPEKAGFWKGLFT